MAALPKYPRANFACQRPKSYVTFSNVAIEQSLEKHEKPQYPLT